MSGLLRNFITFLLGLSAYGSKTIGEVTKLSFWVTPFDSGIRVLKSDKYFQLAEAIGTNGGNQGLQRQAPTRAKADQLLNARLTAPFTGDANDHLYQWDSSRDYNPIDQIDKIKATLLAINSADDERNPPELGVMQKALAKIPNARLLLIPASDQTAGHGTTGQAKWWKQEVGALIQSAPYLK